MMKLGYKGFQENARLVRDGTYFIIQLLKKLEDSLKNLAFRSWIKETFVL